MLFNSIDFAIFFPVFFILYWLVAGNLRLRNILILLSSYLFYGWWDYRFLFLIALSSLVDFYVGQRIYNTENKATRKKFLLISLIVNIGLLVYFKYTNFFIETFVDSFKLFGNDIEVSTLNIILPVGISFYTFQTLSYTIDIYRNQLKPTKNLLAFSSFVAFFPQLVAGPIERASHLLPQFYKTYKFDYEQVKSGLLLMAFGLFKKMVIADRIAVLVNQVYNDPGSYYGFEVIIATIFFAFQIYCDFSGYSDIAIGISRTLGFDLMKNFNNPYLSKSITEFWRRWHISLSTWFRDYVYIPLGGNKKGQMRTLSNLFIVFLVSGLWHGAAMTFVIWGAIHGIIIVLEKSTSKYRKTTYTVLGLDKDNFSNKLFFRVITFAIVCFAWIFFRADNIETAMTIISHSFYDNMDIINEGGFYKLGLSKDDFLLSVFFILTMIVFENQHYKRSFNEFLLKKQSMVFRWSVYVMVVFVILIFGVYGSSVTSEFIYFQF